ncbi:SH3 domain-containing protein [Bacillus timonensis]|uniref:SH3 domain-containing protein n=1 Tax=Bacillus timonensis TaxID=1033734 RepID=UPI00028A269A|nr:SH3 domain-containing protein [Bacillus timonensis]
MKKRKQLFGIILSLIIAVMIVSFTSSHRDTVATSKKRNEETINTTTKTNEIEKDIKDNKTTKATISDKVTTNKNDKTEDVKKENEVKVKTPKAEQSVTSSTLAKPVTKYVNTSSLHVRSGSGTNYPVVMSITQGQAVTVYELTDSWSKVKMNEKTGWVYSKYLSDTKPVVENNVNSVTTVPTPTTVTKPETNGNIADKLKTVAGNQQIILVTTNGYNTNRASIQAFEKNATGKWMSVLNTTGYIGKNGFASNKKEGDGKSPVGKYSIGTAFGQKGNPGTKLPFRSITSDDVWVDDPESPLYNSWQSRSATQGKWKSAENMTHRLYTYGFVINYNTQRTPYKGSAIFFHVGSGYTLGCTATSEANIIKILKWLDPAKNPVIIQTPIQELNKY